MQTGENEQALRKIIDFTRLLSILVLLLHFYFSCYGAFNELHFTYSVVNRVLANIYNLSVFKSILMAKSTALGFLIISLIGTKGKNLPRNQVVWFIRISNGPVHNIVFYMEYHFCYPQVSAFPRRSSFQLPVADGLFYDNSQ